MSMAPRQHLSRHCCAGAHLYYSDAQNQLWGDRPATAAAVHPTPTATTSGMDSADVDVEQHLERNYLAVGSDLYLVGAGWWFLADHEPDGDRQRSRIRPGSRLTGSITTDLSDRSRLRHLLPAAAMTFEVQGSTATLLNRASYPGNARPLA